MYLLSKITQSKLKIPFLILLSGVILFLARNVFIVFFVTFSKNLVVSEQGYKKIVSDLEKDKVQLLLKLEKNKKLEEENTALRKIIEFKEDKQVKLIESRIFAIEPSAFRRVLLIDKGSSDRVKEGMHVVNNKGFLVGKILRAHPKYSELILINDPSFSATVKINDSLGLLKGTLSKELKVSFVELRENINKDDLVSAVVSDSNLMLKVGSVLKVKEDKDSLFLDITVKPFSLPSPSQVVFIVE